MLSVPGFQCLPNQFVAPKIMQAPVVLLLYTVDRFVWRGSVLLVYLRVHLCFVRLLCLAVDYICMVAAEFVIPRHKVGFTLVTFTQ